MADIILATGSRHRIELLENAGINFTAQSAEIDERSVEAPMLGTGSTPADIAEVLAIAKATDVSGSHPSAYVIGCDQTLSLDQKLFHKPEDMEEARRRILELSGKTHALNSAVAIVKDGEVLWSHVALCKITFRELDAATVGQYTAKAGDGILSSVGAYQIEGLGVRLMEKIEGDYFSVIGLPLLPLLAKLRDLDLVDL